MSQPNKPASLSLEDYAYTELRDMIRGGELRPGEQLLQVELAKKLGISRTPAETCPCQLRTRKTYRVFTQR